MSLGIDFLNWRTDQADNFGVRVFGLIARADPVNRRRIERGFRAHVALYEWWLGKSPEPSEDEIMKKADQFEEVFSL